MGKIVLTKEELEHLRHYIRDWNHTFAGVQLLPVVDFALIGQAVTPRPIEWHDASVPPPVDMGAMGYFLVVNEYSKTAFGAYYLNQYPLQCEDDCPDATKENNWASCGGCESGDGHPRTGWFDEAKEHGDRDLYYAMNDVKMWANMPPSPLSAISSLMEGK